MLCSIYFALNSKVIFHFQSAFLVYSFKSRLLQQIFLKLPANRAPPKRLNAANTFIYVFFVFTMRNGWFFVTIFIVFAVVVCLPQLRIRIPMSPWGDAVKHASAEAIERKNYFFVLFFYTRAAFLRTDCVWFCYLLLLTFFLTHLPHITVPDSRQLAFQLSTTTQFCSAADFLFVAFFWRFVSIIICFFIILLWYRPWADSYTQQLCRTECNKKKNANRIW